MPLLRMPSRKFFQVVLPCGRLLWMMTCDESCLGSLLLGRWPFCADNSCMNMAFFEFLDIAFEGCVCWASIMWLWNWTWLCCPCSFRAWISKWYVVYFKTVLMTVLFTPGIDSNWKCIGRTRVLLWSLKPRELPTVTHQTFFWPNSSYAEKTCLQALILRPALRYMSLWCWKTAAELCGLATPNWAVGMRARHDLLQDVALWCIMFQRKDSLVSWDHKTEQHSSSEDALAGL